MKRNFLRSIWVLAISCFLGVSTVYAAGYGINSHYYQPSANMSNYYSSGNNSTMNGPNTPDYPTPDNNSAMNGPYTPDYPTPGNNSTMNGPSVPDWNANDFNSCTSPFTCEDLQGYWDEAKQKCEEIEALPETPEAIKFDSNSSQASIDWGVSNGNVNLKSDRMHLNLHFQRFNKPADIYGAIYLEKEKGLYFISSNPKHIFSKHVVPMYKGIQQSVNATLIPDFDACKVLGKGYKGKMDVYWLVLPKQYEGANSLDGLETAVNNNPYLLQWYPITIDCSK
ncbi:MAG: hypothetical protein GWP10_04315 [Nitrospiraceae bacterium]|nr:hypothetical protein [Nitrospiraceae bacterium]